MSNHAEKQEVNNNDAARKALIDFVKREDRFVTSFERIAAALELIAQKMPWPYLVGVAEPRPLVPYQPFPVISNVNGTAVPASGAFVDLTEGRAIPVGTGG